VKQPDLCDVPSCMFGLPLKPQDERPAHTCQEKMCSEIKKTNRCHNVRKMVHVQLENQYKHVSAGYMTFGHRRLGAAVWAITIWALRRLGTGRLGAMLCDWHIIEISLICILFELKS